MSKIDNVFSIMDEYGFRVHDYIEGGKLCGYEIEGWTSSFDIDMIIFIDLRGKKITADNIIFELADYTEDFDAEEQAVDVWQNGGSWTLRDLITEFEHFEETLIDLCRDLKEMIEKG